MGVVKTPSISKVSLLLSPCTYWATEEAVYFDESKLKETTKRDNGTVFHGWMDNYNTGTVSDEPGVITGEQYEVDKYMAMYQKACEWLDENMPDADSEVAVSIDWSTSTAKTLTGVKNREYPKGRDLMNGTADLVYYDKPTKTIHVGDWKTGESDGAENQLLTLGMAFWMAQWRKATSLVTYSLFVGEIEGKIDVYPTVRTYSVDDMVAHRQRLESAWNKRSRKSLPVFGMHCTKLYCPALAYCPKILENEMALAVNAPDTNYAPSLVDGIPQVVTDTPTNGLEAGYTMAVLSAAKRRIQYIEDRLKDYAKQGNRVTYGGYVWEEGSRGFRWRKGV